ncbi:MAG: VWA domain-containing protein [Halothiobacillus sp.]|jgi:uncharacterized protein YegL|nr:VWA domain-containing protein [Halothiobacillus sp.]
MRRLPVYLLLDTSGSMIGEPIEALRTGVQNLLAALRQDPYALETAYLSVITFSSEAEQLVPLTELAQFQPPQINASGTTALGAALSLLAERIEQEVIKTTVDTTGDGKPVIFLMPDGQPTDDFKKGLNALNKTKFGTFVACAAGPAAETATLQSITESVVRLDTADSNTIKAFFKWVSASISTSSQKVESGQKEIAGLNDLPPPPPEVNIVV